MAGGHTGGYLSVAFSPDGALLASAGSWDCTINLWRVSDGVLVGMFKNLRRQGRHEGAPLPTIPPIFRTPSGGWRGGSEKAVRYTFCR